MKGLFILGNIIFFVSIIFTPRLSIAVCGSGWLDEHIPDAYDGCDFTQACQNHDNCYSSCGSQATSKATCDSNFLNDLNDAVLNGNVSVGCSQAANVYYGAVVNYGQGAYDAAQGDSDNPCKECVNGVIRNKQGDYLFSNEPCKICSNGNKVNAPDGAIPRIDGYFNTCQVCSGGSAVNNDSAPCTDVDSCTINDHCENGHCVGTRPASPVNPDCNQ
ncbi:hypothetical protein GKODMF_12410 [Candidatus Electrothrix gigas]